MNSNTIVSYQQFLSPIAFSSHSSTLVWTYSILYSFLINQPNGSNLLDVVTYRYSFIVQYPVRKPTSMLRWFILATVVLGLPFWWTLHKNLPTNLLSFTLPMFFMFLSFNHHIFACSCAAFSDRIVLEQILILYMKLMILPSSLFLL